MRDRSMASRLEPGGGGHQVVARRTDAGEGVPARRGGEALLAAGLGQRGAVVPADGDVVDGLGRVEEGVEEAELSLARLGATRVEHGDHAGEGGGGPRGARHHAGEGGDEDVELNRVSGHVGNAAARRVVARDGV